MIPLLTPQTGPPLTAEEAEVPPVDGGGVGTPFLAIMSEGDDLRVLDAAQLDLVETKIAGAETPPKQGEEAALPDTFPVSEGTAPATQATRADKAEKTPRAQAPQGPTVPADRPDAKQHPVTAAAAPLQPEVRSPAQRFIEGTLHAVPTPPVAAAPEKALSLPMIKAETEIAQIQVPKTQETLPKTTALPDIPPMTEKASKKIGETQDRKPSKDAPKPTGPAPEVFVRPAPMPVAPKEAGRMPVLATALQEFGAFKRSAEPDVGVATLAQDRATPTTHATQATTPAAPQTARHVAHQIAVAVTQGSGGTTEIALRPQELGNVRLALTASETAVNVVILTERPETQDLLRRHIDTLAQEFKALGYDNISFSFGGRDQSQKSQNAAVAAEGADMTTPDLPHDASPQMTHKSGLDLRL